jgi:hypothetical protein
MSVSNIPKALVIIKGEKVHIYCSKSVIPKFHMLKEELEKQGLQVEFKEPEYYEHNENVVACALEHFEKHD